MSRKRKNRFVGKDFWRSFADNELDYTLYYERLLELALSMFEWKNLPETVDARFLELCLICEGQALFFEDDVLGYLALRMTAGAPLDVYQIPTKRMAYASNAYRYKATNEDSVIVYNNMLHTSDIAKLYKYSKILYDLDNTAIVNAHAQKTPILLTCDESQKLTLQNLYTQYDGNAPVIYGNKQLSDYNGIQAISTGAPYIADKIYQLKQQYWNEALTMLGIPNTNNNKKERLVTSESENQNGATYASRCSRLYERRTACDKINRMFGLNISVDYASDLVTEYEENNNEFNTTEPDEEVDGNE